MTAQEVGALLLVGYGAVGVCALYAIGAGIARWWGSR